MAECLPSTSDGDCAEDHVQKMIDEISHSMDKLAYDASLDKIKEYLLNSPIYRPIFQHQEQVDGMCTILDRNKDVHLSLPSGYGRTLFYLLPAIYSYPKVTIVITAINERIEHLMKNATPRLRIKALQDHTTAEQRHILLKEFNSKKTTATDLLYVTSEQVASETFKKLYHYLLRDDKLAYVFVDEAYCEYHWIYYPKTEYKIIGHFRKMNYSVPWIVLTDLVCREVVQSIRNTLKLKKDWNFAKFSVPSYRAHLYYDVIFDDEYGKSYDHLKEFIEQCLKKYTDKDSTHAVLSAKPSGIIFCKTRDVVERITAELARRGLLVVAHHSGLTDAARENAQELFFKGFYQVIVVTGMFETGSHKANVRFIVHWGLPSNLSAYYNETGEAGVNGEQSRCRIYLTKQSITYFTRENLKDLEIKAGRSKTLQEQANAVRSLTMTRQSFKMAEYCRNMTCRHLKISDHFGDPMPYCINNCDVCSNKLELAEKNDLSDPSVPSDQLRLNFDKMNRRASKLKLISDYMTSLQEHFYDLNTGNKLSTDDSQRIVEICNALVQTVDEKTTKSQDVFKYTMPDVKDGSPPTSLAIENKDDSPSSSSLDETEIKNNEN